MKILVASIALACTACSSTGLSSDPAGEHQRSGGEWIAASTTSGDVESIDLVTDEGGEFLLQVHVFPRPEGADAGPPFESGTYALSLRIE